MVGNKVICQNWKFLSSFQNWNLLPSSFLASCQHWNFLRTKFACSLIKYQPVVGNIVIYGVKVISNDIKVFFVFIVNIKIWLYWVLLTTGRTLKIEPYHQYWVVWWGIQKSIVSQWYQVNLSFYSLYGPPRDKQSTLNGHLTPILGCMVGNQLCQGDIKWI